MAAQFGRRLRRGATTTAVAAAAVAALSASQAPGVTSAASGTGQEASDVTPPPGTPVTGNSPYYTDLPPLNTPDKPGASGDLPELGPGEAGIPASVLAAYKQAEQTIAASDPACRLPWQLLAAIGKVESGQARGGRVDANGTTLSPILGPVLNGVGFANISDTDDGAYDDDPVYDRAVGPMQFIPQTWQTWGQDANADGRKDPNNIYDAALAAGRYLCAGGRDLGNKDDLDRAILGYNHSREYLRTVLSWFEYYKRGTHEVPDGTGKLPVGDGPDSAGPLPTPTPTPRPSKPTTPKPTPSPDTAPGPSEPASPPTTPTPTPTPTPPPTTTPPPAPAPVTRIENAGTGPLTAVVGREFAERATVRAENAEGQPVAKVAVRFMVVGETDARFTGGRTSVVAATGADGTVSAPALIAGERTGDFTVRATVVERSLPGVEFTATVTEREADSIVRTDTKTLEATTGGDFADVIRVKAACDGVAASGVSVTATMIVSKDDPAENGRGPYFKADDGTVVRTLTGLRTGADGVLELPKVFADDTAGTFVLRLTAPGGGSLDIELKVTEPASETPAPDPSPAPSPSSSPSPSPSPTA
ncbi:lytic transglycosylase domain-containing protein [Streptomyces peucetius]|uniref:Lytic transglycosylase domain-containing protein n=1 Tax=Streptomyces peucetius TaxID=1950 RepID=A0ABY6I3X7_STRPE|nr:lytic transglycosylase domain-containing protein [Streptomyces peucetius]UYQ61536.1 lytic transglycosylase domain-containing protein [Streptomyces peucetius]